MIKQNTLLKIVDNSGGTKGKCVKILGRSNKKTAYSGDLIIVSIVKIKNKLNKFNIKKKQLFRAIILNCKKIKEKKTGIYYNFKQNSIILLDKQKNPLGTRIFELVPRYLKIKFLKLFSLSYFII